MILRGGIAMLQAPVLDGLPFDPFSFQQDGLSPTEVGVGSRAVRPSLRGGFESCSREEAPEFSATEEQITRNDVVAVLGEPIETIKIEDGHRVDVYEYDKGCFKFGIFLVTPVFDYEQTDRMLTVEYGPDGSFLWAQVWPGFETPEEVIARYERWAEQRAKFEVRRETAQNRIVENHRKQVVSAECGDHEAQYWLGLKYRAGTDPVTRSEVKSYVWLTLAGAGGHSTAISERDEDLAPGMTPKQIAEAERLVTEWKPNPAECEVEGEHSKPEVPWVWHTINNNVLAYSEIGGKGESLEMSSYVDLELVRQQGDWGVFAWLVARRTVQVATAPASFRV